MTIGTATADTPVEQIKAPMASESAAQGLMLAESSAYRTVDHGLLSHTHGLVVQEPIALELLLGGVYQLVVRPPGKAQETYILDPIDWELHPANVEQIVPTVHTLKVDTTNAQVLMQGEFEGEDLPLYDIELKFKGGLVNALLHPNQPPTHKLEKGQSKLVRLGFEKQRDAQEWFALIAFCLGLIGDDHPTLASLPGALAASKKVHEFKHLHKLLHPRQPAA